MSLMTEKRANELLIEYKQAETIGDNTKAIQIEHDLNSAGWLISQNEKGLIIKRKSNSVQTIDEFYTPKEPKIEPLKEDDNPNKNLWKIIGYTILTLTVISGVIYLIIKYRRGKQG